MGKGYYKKHIEQLKKLQVCENYLKEDYTVDFKIKVKIIGL